MSNATCRRGAPKFHRETAAARRDLLIEATLRCLEAHGHEGSSIRRISARAGVSSGLISHHFHSKAALIAAAYDRLATRLQESLQRRVDEDNTSPRERLSGFFRASFEPDSLDPALFKVWLVFWGMIMHSPEMRAVHDSAYRRYRSILEKLLAQIARDNGARLRLRTAAIALSALLDGLWIELSLSPANFKPAEAIALCEDWVDALCGAETPHLLRKTK